MDGMLAILIVLTRVQEDSIALVDNTGQDWS